MTRVDFSGSLVLNDHDLMLLKAELAVVLNKYAVDKDWSLSSVESVSDPDEVATA